MGDLIDETKGTPHDAPEGRRCVTSDRKVKAKRENAKKSTGPRTPRGCIREIATGQRVIPNAEDLDKVLRYEAAIDRNLTRALDRLERLQDRRKALEGMEPRPTAHNRSNTKSTVFRMPPKSTKSYPTKMPSRGN